MAENKLQEKVLGSMPRLAWEYRNIPSNSDSPLPLKERTLEGFRGDPWALSAGRRWLRKVRRLEVWGEEWFSFMESTASAEPSGILEAEVP